LDRIVNYIFGLVIIYLFVLEGRSEDHFLILSGLVLSTIVAYTAFIGNWITLDATKAVIVLGTITLGFGGWWLAFALIFFFASSSLITRGKRIHGVEDEEARTLHHDLHIRRDGYQVWSNGFWVAIFSILWFLTSMDAFFIAAFAVIASATADTWATEIGCRNPGKTRLITTLKTVAPGTDGGVSLKGTTAAIFGSLIISVFILSFPEYPYTIPAVLFLSGMIGSLADSYIGANLQTADISQVKPGDYLNTAHSFKNNLVNWISTGIGGLIAFVMTKIILL
jgi:uncharacterized protein (TIGR00297 family)